MEQPEKVDFEVTVMGGSTLSGLIPSLKAWLVGFARDSLISMYVTPEHWTYRIDPVSPAVHTALLPSTQNCICVLYTYAPSQQHIAFRVVYGMMCGRLHTHTCTHTCTHRYVWPVHAAPVLIVPCVQSVQSVPSSACVAELASTHLHWLPLYIAYEYMCS